MRISHGILKSNAELCGKRTGYDLDMLVVAIRLSGENSQWLRDHMGLDERPVVFAILRDGAEWKAGIRHGDILRGVMGQPVATGKAAGIALYGALKNCGGKPIDLELERDGVPYSVSVAPSRMCDCRIRVWQRETVDVLHDDNGFELGLGLLKFASKDDDLAVVMAHELAHQMLGHEQHVGWAALGRRFWDLFTGGGYGAPYTREEGVQADRFGLYYAARAGFSLEHAPDVWKRVKAHTAFPESFTKNRPYFASDEREKALTATRDEIMAKIKAGKPLVPDDPLVPTRGSASAQNATNVD